MLESEESLSRHSLTARLTQLRESIAIIRTTTAEHRPSSRRSGDSSNGARITPRSRGDSSDGGRVLSGSGNDSFLVEVGAENHSGKRIVSSAIPAKHVGYMKKKGKVNTAWKMRFFVLDKGVLTYYMGETVADSKVGKDQRGVIALDGHSVEEVMVKNKVLIHLKGESRTYEFKAKTDRGAWFSALQKHAIYKNST